MPLRELSPIVIIITERVVHRSLPRFARIIKCKIFFGIYIFFYAIMYSIPYIYVYKLSRRFSRGENHQYPLTGSLKI